MSLKKFSMCNNFWKENKKVTIDFVIEGSLSISETKSSADNDVDHYIIAITLLDFIFSI
jgi:hypothetical protein